MIATRRFALGGLAIGAAGALKLFAWPVAVALAVYARDPGPAGRLALRRRRVGRTDPDRLAGTGYRTRRAGGERSGLPVRSRPRQQSGRVATAGHLIATWLPGGGAIAMLLLLSAAVVAAVVAIRTPPRTAAAAAVFAGSGLLAAFLLLPATRFGYLLYPAVLLVWAAALRIREDDEPASPAAERPRSAEGRLVVK